MAAPGRLAGEIALVTGSTGEIGRAITRCFAAEGATVAVTGRDLDRGDAVVHAIRSDGGAAQFRQADLSHEGDCSDLVHWVVEEFGGLTVLVNNAAASDAGDASVHDLGTDAWEHVLRVDLTAAMWVARAAIEAMLDAEHGSIVNISSQVAERGAPHHAAHAAAKAGLNALTRSIAVDHAVDRIRCNAISPGYVVHVESGDALDDDRRQQLERMHLTRLGTPEDIARAALFLASADSDWITGANLPVDGGSTIARASSFG